MITVPTSLSRTVLESSVGAELDFVDVRPLSMMSVPSSCAWAAVRR